MVRIQPSQAGTIDGDENVDRGNWSRQLDFLLSCLGYAVGLGNFWRFPHLSYTNGGGAFFIPYLIMVVFIGMPMFFMEIAIGQFSSCGPVKAYKFCPLLSGISMGMVTLSALVSIYYNLIIAWAIFYLFESFQRTLPWSKCNNQWNSGMCSELWPKTACNGVSENIYENGTCYKTINDGHNSSIKFQGLWDHDLAAAAGIKPVLPAEEYFFYRILGISSGIDVLGGLQWHLLLCLLLAWFLVYVSIIRGVKSSGKVVYFTSLFPYVVLAILFVKGLTLDGAGEGIRYYVSPDWSKLTESKVWSNAASQVFFSLSICWGGLMTLSSYNRFQNNILKDSIIVTLGNSATSIFAGIVIYSYLGYLAHSLGMNISEVSEGGTGLAFVVFPAAIQTMPFPPFWSILFFGMLITLGLDSQFVLLETVVTTIFDAKPSWKERKPIVLLFCVVVLFTPGAFMCTQGGIYIFNLMDNYCAGVNVIMLGLLETSSIFLYGRKRFSNDIKLMLGKAPSQWWIFCWYTAGPLCLLLVLAMSIAGKRPENSPEPIGATAIGLLLSLSVLIWVPIMAVYQLKKADGDSIIEKVKFSIRPDPYYGPALYRHRAMVTYVQGFIIDPANEPAQTQQTRMREQPEHLPQDSQMLNTALRNLMDY